MNQPPIATITPDWPPHRSAWQLPEGSRRYGSTGQLWEVRERRWVRLEVEDKRETGDRG